MINLRAIGHIALCEARLLQRSWPFRISLAIALFYLFMFNLIMSSPATHIPHYMVALPGALPLGNIKLLNVYLGIMAALLATEFVKRDRRDDTLQTVLVHSFTNVDYILGKVLGIATVFGALEVIVLIVAAVLHHFFAPVPLVWQPYAMAILIAAVPTMIFTTGLGVLLVTLLRSQPVVFVLVFSVGTASLSWAGFQFFFFFDLFAFHIPLMWSDFIGAGNERQLVLVRATHLLFGLACIAATPLFSRRLPQSRLASITTGVMAILCAGGAWWTGSTYIDSQLAARDYRDRLRNVSAEALGLPAPRMVTSRLDVDHAGTRLSVAAELRIVNPHEQPLDTLVLTLNPGLSVSALTEGATSLAYRRDEHVLRVAPEASLAPGDTVQLQIAYEGRIDERFCYLDVESERIEAQYRLWLHSIPKRYSSVTPDYLHLTAETGWYPRAGIPPGAAFPASGHRDYSDYEISVVVPDGWSAFSQGATQVDSLTGLQRFRTDNPLSQVSLTMGRYEVRELVVDDVIYSLAFRPGHEYFDTYLDSVAGALPELIRELKNEYEVALGMEYPYPRLRFVETPIQFYVYDRLWTVARESVQPEIVFLPEMGAVCEGCDFRQQKRRSRWSQEMANQAETAQDLQRGYLRTFAVLDLLGMQTQRGRVSEMKGRHHLLPGYISYVTHLSSERWPVLNYAFESFFSGRVEPPQATRDRHWGVTLEERANLALKEMSLEDLLGDSATSREIHKAAIQAKGRHLLQLFAAASGAEEFSSRISAAATASRYRGLSDVELIELVAAPGVGDPESEIERWYRASELPGYEIGKAESYLVRDGERTRTQVEFEVSNPTSVDGLIEVGFRRRESEITPFWISGNDQWMNNSTVVAMPAGTRKRVGILLDTPAAEMIIDTYVSRNIPSLIAIPFSDLKLRRRARPFAGEETYLLADDPQPAVSEYVVDNEDEGFEVHEVDQANYLRRLLVDWFDLREREIPYVGMRHWDPPGTWEPTIERRMYGRFVLSGRYKKASDGRSTVSWRTEIARTGEYDLYFYVGLAEELQYSYRRHRQWRNEGDLDLLVHHEGGVEPVPFNIAEAEEGWNHIGTYRLAAGPAHVELTDRSESGGTIIADAVKWVERL